MSNGLDSIGASELVAAMCSCFSTDLPQTILFDHPTIAAMTGFLTTTMEAIAVEEQG